MTEKGDMSRTLVLMALWQDAELLLQHRTHNDNGVGFFGGRKKDYERPMQGAIRETWQETGLDIQPEQVTQLAVCEDDGWKIFAFQSLLASGLVIPKVEGTLLKMTPAEAWEDSRLMPATRVVLKETIMIPNGIIDN